MSTHQLNRINRHQQQRRMFSDVELLLLLLLLLLMATVARQHVNLNEWLTGVSVQATSLQWQQQHPAAHCQLLTSINYGLLLCCRSVINSTTQGEMLGLRSGNTAVRFLSGYRSLRAITATISGSWTHFSVIFTCSVYLWLHGFTICTAISKEIVSASLTRIRSVTDFRLCTLPPPGFSVWEVSKGSISPTVVKTCQGRAR